MAVAFSFSHLEGLYATVASLRQAGGEKGLKCQCKGEAKTQLKVDVNEGCGYEETWPYVG